MTPDKILELLQTVLTITDPDDYASVASGKAIITLLSGMVRMDRKPHGYIIRLLANAENKYEYLVEHKSEYEMVRGDAQGNAAKLQRLGMFIYPHC